MASESYLLAVPDEILLQILAYTETFPGFRACSCTCKRLAKLCDHPSLQPKKIWWDKTRVTKNTHIHNFGRSISTVNEQFCTFIRTNRGFTSGKHYWTIEVHKARIDSAITVGVAHSTVQQNDAFLGSKFGGFAGHASVKKGTKIGILLDMDCDPIKKMLYYFHNDILISHTVCPITEELVNATHKEEEKRKLYPAISMWYHGNHVTASFELPPPLNFNKVPCD